MNWPDLNLPPINLWNVPRIGRDGMNNADMPAMPIERKVGDATQSSGGLTKREYFAGLAMQGACSSPDVYHESPEAIAALAVKQADALLAQLEATK